MDRLIFAAVALAVSGCSHENSDIQPGKWTCDKLIQPVIDMSKDRELKVLEITDASETPSTTPDHLECRGSAVWSRGEDWITYGAYVSDGGKIVLEYKQGV